MIDLYYPLGTTLLYYLYLSHVRLFNIRWVWEQHYMLLSHIANMLANGLTSENIWHSLKIRYCRGVFLNILLTKSER